MQKIYTIERYNEMVAETFKKIEELGRLKGAEYAGDADRLGNFRRNGLDQDLPMESIWRVYTAKHWDAIGQYVRDIKDGKTRERMESIDGRVDDMIVYLLLFKAMIDERTEKPVTGEGGELWYPHTGSVQPVTINTRVDYKTAETPIGFYDTAFAVDIDWSKVVFWRVAK